MSPQMSLGEQNCHRLETVKQRTVSVQRNATFNCEFGHKNEREIEAPEHRKQTLGQVSFSLSNQKVAARTSFQAGD